MIIRLSQRLHKKIKVAPLVAAPLDENPYADWTARVFTVERSQYILMSHTTSMYSVLMPGRGITNGDQFTRRALATLREFMIEDDLESIHTNFVAPASESIQFSKALNRSVTGSMNELELVATHLLSEVETSPYKAGLHLNNILLSMIAKPENERYDRPRTVFLTLTT